MADSVSALAEKLPTLPADDATLASASRSVWRRLLEPKPRDAFGAMTAVARGGLRKA